MATTIRLTIKQHRFGVLGFGLILLALAAVAGALAGYLGSLDLAACDDGPSAACVEVGTRIQAVTPLALLIEAGSLPTAIIAGVFVGVPLVATEIERGTAVLPWTFGRSRVAWLLPRLVILGSVLAVLATLPGLALDALVQATDPDVPIAENLALHEIRGWLVPARALVGFGAGVFAGAVLGRTLPGLLVGLLIAGALVIGVIPLADSWNRADQVVLADPRGALALGGALRDTATGEIVSYAEVGGIMSLDDPAFPERFEEVRLGIPGSSAPLVIGRELASHGVELLILLGASVLVVHRRRPY
jgi:hypothetical protein